MGIYFIIIIIIIILNIFIIYDTRAMPKNRIYIRVIYKIINMVPIFI